MKPSMQTKIVCLKAGFAALALSLLFFSCEPKYWQEYVMANPEPITELTVTGVVIYSGMVEIKFTYLAPAFAVQTITDYTPVIYFFLREEGSPAEEFLAGRSNYDKGEYVAGVTVSMRVNVSENNVERGGTYYLVGYTVDAEGQKSEPTLSETFDVPLHSMLN